MAQITSEVNLTFLELRSKKQYMQKNIVHFHLFLMLKYIKKNSIILTIIIKILHYKTTVSVIKKRSVLMQLVKTRHS